MANWPEADHTGFTQPFDPHLPLSLPLICTSPRPRLKMGSRCSALPHAPWLLAPLCSCAGSPSQGSLGHPAVRQPCARGHCLSNRRFQVCRVSDPQSPPALLPARASPMFWLVLSLGGPPMLGLDGGSAAARSRTASYISPFSTKVDS